MRLLRMLVLFRTSQTLQRAFENASNLVQSSERTLDDAVKTLGTTS